MKHSTPEEDIELANVLSPNEEPPLVVSLDTSTIAGQNWRSYVLQSQDERNHISNLWKKYKESGDKRYLSALDGFLGGADNLPTDE